MEELKKILGELGLSKYKIETYIDLLKINSGTIQEIAKNSNVPACKLYETLKWLHEKGYISLILQKPLTYMANNPKMMIKDEISKKENELKNIKKEINELKVNFPKANKEIIQIINTKQALDKKIKECLINSKLSVCYIVNHWPTDYEIFRISKKKINHGVEIKAMGPVTKENMGKVKESLESGIKIRNLVPEKTRFSIFDKKIVIIRLRKEENSHISILIKSEVLGEILYNYFNMIWNNQKPIKLK